MNRDALLQVSEIVSHSGCPDGIGAAMVCTAAYVAMGVQPPPTNFILYSTKSHTDLTVRPRQLFIDITPPKDRWEEWKGSSPIVLDHHETVSHIIDGLNGIYGGPDESGTMLVYSNIMLPLVGDKISPEDLTTWERFTHLCMVRDTWKDTSPDWYEACALSHALLLYGQKWALNMANTGKVPPMKELLFIGEKLYDKVLRASKSFTRSSVKYDIIIGDKTTRIAFFNLSERGSMSDIAHCIMNDMLYDAVVGYFYLHEDEDMRTIVSVRTNGCFSASDLAKSFGGGGHGKAAGFRLLGDLSPNTVMMTTMKRIIELNSA